MGNNDFLDCSDISSDPKNDNVELIMQKYEADIRAHVKMQKEMQKLAEALQTKLEDSESVQQIGEQKFLDLERRHYSLLSDLNSVKEENRKLKVLLEEIDKYNNNLNMSLMNSSINNGAAPNKRDNPGNSGLGLNSSHNVSQVGVSSKHKKRVHLRTTSCLKLNLNSSGVKPDSRNTSIIGHSGNSYLISKGPGKSRQNSRFPSKELKPQI